MKEVVVQVGKGRCRPVVHFQMTELNAKMDHLWGTGAPAARRSDPDFTRSISDMMRCRRERTNSTTSRRALGHILAKNPGRRSGNFPKSSAFVLLKITMFGAWAAPNHRHLQHDIPAQVPGALFFAPRSYLTSSLWEGNC